MKTTNIVSTPEITGNIGSCEIKSVKEKSYGGVIKNEYKVVMINNCSGQVTESYNYTDYTFLSFLGVILLMIIAFFFIKALIEDNY